MKFLALLLMLLLGLLAVKSSPAAAEGSMIWRYNRHNPEPAFPHSKRTQAVWDSFACWNDCQSYTTWNLVDCLERDRQGHCLKLTDAADRACQRTCRTRGGPLLPIDTLFPLAH
jgi:hypothetical protein